MLGKETIRKNKISKTGENCNFIHAARVKTATKML